MTTQVKQHWTTDQQATIERLMKEGSLTRRKAIHMMLKSERGEGAPVPVTPKPKAAAVKVSASDRRVEVEQPAFSLAQAADAATQLIEGNKLSPGLIAILTPLASWARKTVGYRRASYKASKKRAKGKK